MTTFAIAISGFLIGLSLIVAIGPQNALIIRQGIKGVGVIPVIVVCMISDVLLIFGGTAGVGALVDRAPAMLEALKWMGAAYLLWFAYVCFRDGLRPQRESLNFSEAPSPAKKNGSPSSSRKPHGGSAVATKQAPAVTTQPARPWVKPVLAALAFTWLNPAAYIDVLVMLGGMANQHGPDGRWVFAFGALAASFLWFPFIAYASTRFAHVLSKPKVWAWVNLAIGVLMLVLCARLIMH
ncbi:LysE family transporter [Corynebacterium sp. 35RC1]|nr:LysE family transporter [Corynebacterium sp. 35RC1]